jgi:hypothetical protein
MKYILALFLAFFSVFGLGIRSAFAGISHNGGEYINLSGSGLNANFHSGNYCSTSSGTCKGPSVVKFTCDGRNPDCRSGESGFSSSQSLGNPGCGKTVQLDVFDKQCRRSDGSWDDSCKLLDYMVWYSGDCKQNTPPKTTPESCRDYRPLNTQFRKTGDSTWISGDDLSKKTLKEGDRIDVNCFAKTGTALLPNAVIDVRKPDGSTQRVANSGELRNYKIEQSGSYRFTCSSTKFDYCYDGDSFRVQKTVSPSPVPTPIPSPTPEPQHASRCVDLDIVKGNNQTVPAEVTLRATAEDNQKGGIQKYKFFFGDGTQQETDQREVKHKYESSGKFVAKVEAKDSKGNWISSNSCETTVTVKPSVVESHKSACSDLYVVSRSNRGRAPSDVELKVSGYDNKGDLQAYKIEFGDGKSAEGSDRTFSHRYETAGTYQAKAYVKNSKGEWVGGNSNCRTNVYIETEPLTKQPDTGTPTILSIMGLASGGMSGALFFLRRKLIS